MKKTDLREFIGIALFIAIISVMAAIPQIGYIKVPFLPFDITLLFVPVLVGSALYGKKGALILGLCFGLSSLAVAWLRPSTPFDLVFRNPLISVLPRVLFTIIFLYLLDATKKVRPHIIGILVSVVFTVMLVLFIIYNLSSTILILTGFLIGISVVLSVISYKYESAKIVYVLPTFLSILLHSFMVLLAIVLLYSSTLVDTFNIKNIFNVISLIIVTNSMFEATISAIIMQFIMPQIRRVFSE